MNYNMKRKIKKDKPIFKFYFINTHAIQILNTDNVLIYTANSIFDLAETCAMLSNMPWQFDDSELDFATSKGFVRSFWNLYDEHCKVLADNYYKLYHTNTI